VTMPQSEVTQDSDTRQQMIDLMFGYQVTQAVRAVADLSLADHLGGGGLTAAEVAEREGSAADATFRLMRGAGIAGAPMGAYCGDHQQDVTARRHYFHWPPIQSDDKTHDR
jgi:hypothetical protein